MQQDPEYLEKVFNAIGGNEKGYNYGSFVNRMSSDSEYNQKVFDAIGGNEKGYNYESFTTRTGLVKKNGGDSPSGILSTGSMTLDFQASDGIEKQEEKSAYQLGTGVQPTETPQFLEGVVQRRPEPQQDFGRFMVTPEESKKQERIQRAPALKNLFSEYTQEDIEEVLEQPEKRYLGGKEILTGGRARTKDGSVVSFDDLKEKEFDMEDFAAVPETDWAELLFEGDEKAIEYTENLIESGGKEYDTSIMSLLSGDGVKVVTEIAGANYRNFVNEQAAKAAEISSFVSDELNKEIAKSEANFRRQYETVSKEVQTGLNVNEIYYKQGTISEDEYKKNKEALTRRLEEVSNPDLQANLRRAKNTAKSLAVVNAEYDDRVQGRSNIGKGLVNAFLVGTNDVLVGSAAIIYEPLSWARDFASSIENVVNDITESLGMGKAFDPNKRVLLGEKDEFVSAADLGLGNLGYQLQNDEELIKSFGSVGGTLYEGATGLVGTLPAMMAGGYGLFAQGYGVGFQEAKAAGMDNQAATIYGATLGMVQAKLEKVGLANLLASKSIIGNLTSRSLRQVVGARTNIIQALDRAVNQEVKGFLATGAKRLSSGFLSEFETGALQTIAEGALQHATNIASQAEVFEDIDLSASTIFRGALLEGVGGAYMGTLNVFSGRERHNFSGFTDGQIQMFRSALTDPKSKLSQQYLNYLNQQFQLGNISESEYGKRLNNFRNARNVFSQVPSEYSNKDAGKAADLLQAKRAIEAKLKRYPEMPLKKDRAALARINQELDKIDAKYPASEGTTAEPTSMGTQAESPLEQPVPEQPITEEEITIAEDEVSELEEELQRADDEGTLEDNLGQKAYRNGEEGMIIIDPENENTIVFETNDMRYELGNKDEVGGNLIVDSGLTLMPPEGVDVVTQEEGTPETRDLPTDVYSIDGKQYKIIGRRRDKKGKSVVRVKEVDTGLERRFVGEKAERILKDQALREGARPAPEPTLKVEGKERVPVEPTVETKEQRKQRIAQEKAKLDAQTEQELNEKVAESEKAVADFENALLEEMAVNERNKDLVQVKGNVFQVTKKNDGTFAVSKMRTDGKLIRATNPAEIRQAVAQFKRQKTNAEKKAFREAEKLIKEARAEEQDKILEWLDKAISNTSSQGRAFDATIGLPLAAINSSLKVLRAAYKAGKTLSQAIQDAINHIKQQGYAVNERQYKQYILDKLKQDPDAIQKQETRDISDAERAEGVQEVEEEIRKSPKEKEAEEITGPTAYPNIGGDGAVYVKEGEIIVEDPSYKYAFNVNSQEDLPPEFLNVEPYQVFESFDKNRVKEGERILFTGQQLLDAGIGKIAPQGTVISTVHLFAKSDIVIDAKFDGAERVVGDEKSLGTGDIKRKIALNRLSGKRVFTTDYIKDGKRVVSLINTRAKDANGKSGYISTSISFDKDTKINLDEVISTLSYINSTSQEDGVLNKENATETVGFIKEGVVVELDKPLSEEQIADTTEDAVATETVQDTETKPTDISEEIRKSVKEKEAEEINNMREQELSIYTEEQLDLPVGDTGLTLRETINNDYEEALTESDAEVQPEVDVQPDVPTASDMETAEVTGVPAAGFRSLYKIYRDMYGFGRKKAMVTAVIADRMIGAMAKRKGVSKEDMYSVIKFRKGEDALFKSLKGTDKILYQIVGRNANLSDIAIKNYDIAVQLEESGVSENKIWAQTGWMRGTDGKWRYEIMDDLPIRLTGDAEVDGRVVDALERMQNGETVKWIDLFGEDSRILEAYPQMADYNVKLENLPPETNAAYNPNTNTIEINTEANIVIDDMIEAFQLAPGMSLDNEVTGTLNALILHEAQHAIQYSEGFARGTSPNEMMDWYNTRLQSLMLELEQYNDILSDPDALEQSYYDKEDLINFAKEKQQEIEDFKKKYTRRKDGSITYLESYQMYDRAAGEVEARVVQKRMRLSEEERRNTPLKSSEDVRREDQIILFQGEQGAMIARDSDFIIYALTNPNVSTPLHELAHVFEHYLTDAERKQILKWAGHKTWTVETSEKFARGFERFLASPDSAASSVRKYFKKFKEWLEDIYDGITGSDIDVELNADMLSVYNNMLGADYTLSREAYYAVRRANPLLFKDGKLISQNDFDAIRKEFWRSITTGRLGRARRLWAKSTTRMLMGDNPLGAFFRNNLTQLETITRLMDNIDKTRFFTKNIYGRLRNATEQYMSGKRDAQQKLDDIANSIDGVTNGFNSIVKLLSGSMQEIASYDMSKKNSLNTNLFSLDQLARVYALSKNSEQRKKLKRMGFSDATIDEIKTTLGPEVVEFVDKTVDYLSDEYYGTVNDVYKELTGQDLNKVDNYFPTKTVTNIAKETKIDPDATFEQQLKQEWQSALKEREDVSGQVDITESFTSALVTHFDSMEHYKAYAKEVRPIDQILNGANVKIWSEALGVDRILKEAILSEINPYSNMQLSGNPFSFLYNNFVSFVLSLKGLQIPRQMTSFLTAYEEYGGNFPEFILDYSAVLLQLPKYWKYFRENSATFDQRVKNNMTGDLYLLTSGGRKFVPKSLASSSKSEYYIKKAGRGLRAASGLPTTIGDALGVMGYAAAFRKDIRNGMSVEDALNKFNQYDSTQQSQTNVGKVQIQRSGHGFVRAIIPFSSSVFALLNVGYRGFNGIYNNVKQGNINPRKWDKRDIRALLVGYMGSSLLFEFVNSFGQLFFGDEEEKEKALFNLAWASAGLNSMERIPFFGVALSQAKSAAKDYLNIEDYNPFLLQGEGLNAAVEWAEMYRKAANSKEYAEFLKIMTGMLVGVNVDPAIGAYNFFSTTFESGDFEATDDFYEMIGMPKSLRPSTGSKDVSNIIRR